LICFLVFSIGSEIIFAQSFQQSLLLVSIGYFNVLKTFTPVNIYLSLSVTGQDDLR